MPKKETSSDKLKELFEAHGLGSVKDWKRLSKKKNEQGQVERIFENKKSGDQLQVTELGDGHFHARRLANVANASFSKAEIQDDFAKAPNIEGSPQRNASADQVIESLLEYEQDIPAKLIKDAGQALANRFVFAVGYDDDLSSGYYVEVSPKDRDYDGNLEHIIGTLMPKKHGGEVTELTFDMSAYDSPAKIVSEMHKQGFVWDRAYQNSLAPEIGIEIEKALSGASPRFAVPPSPKP